MGKVVFAAIGLGVLTGVLLGLSVSSAVGAIASALMAVLLAFVGVRGESARGSIGPCASQRAPDPVEALRIGVFAMSTLVGVFGALCLRAYDPIGPSIKSQIDELTGARYTLSEARSIVAFREFGLLDVGRWTTSSDVKPYGAPLLFRYSSSMCNELDPSQFNGSVHNTLEAWSQIGDANWGRLADLVRRLPVSDQLDATAVIHSFVCE